MTVKSMMSDALGLFDSGNGGCSILSWMTLRHIGKYSAVSITITTIITKRRYFRTRKARERTVFSDERNLKRRILDAGVPGSGDIFHYDLSLKIRHKLKVTINQLLKKDNYLLSNECNVDESDVVSEML